jgi:hypothetical protein
MDFHLTRVIITGMVGPGRNLRRPRDCWCHLGTVPVCRCLRGDHKGCNLRGTARACNIRDVAKAAGGSGCWLGQRTWPTLSWDSG